MQFWEDVDEGLEEIEQFYVARGMNIDRVLRFAESASGKIPPPTGYAAGHQPSEEHIEGLTAKPFWDVLEYPDLFPWATELEEKSETISREFAAKLERDQKMFASDSAWQSQIMGGGWSAVRLQRLGVWNSDNVKEFPETYELLRSLRIPFAVRGVCFARQAPGTGVQPHSDGRNFILTSHLGLSIPEGCWIKVGEEQRTWQEGKLTTLDTSFEHSTGNPGDSERNVLIIDFWHPELTEAERAGLEFVYDLRNKFESGQVPFRKPKALNEKEGLGSLWGRFTRGA
jgi:aspartate beta-hydroxylase